MTLYEVIATYEDGMDSEREQVATYEEATKIRKWYISLGFDPELVEIQEI